MHTLARNRNVSLGYVPIHIFPLVDSVRVLLCRCAQREGMGLLEYQAMPSLRDAAHD
jgi:hypothetical protein